MSDLLRGAVPRSTYLPGRQEADFQRWYEGHSKSSGLDQSPDAPEHDYDYRAAFLAGAEPSPADDGYLHWPSQFKQQDHSNRFVPQPGGGILDSLRGALLDK